jgi:hypothetical protein
MHDLAAMPSGKGRFPQAWKIKTAESRLLKIGTIIPPLLALFSVPESSQPIVARPAILHAHLTVRQLWLSGQPAFSVVPKPHIQIALHSEAGRLEKHLRWQPRFQRLGR